MTRAIEFVLWQPVYYNGAFSHHTERRVIVKGCVVREAKEKVHLRPASTSRVGDILVTTVDDEYVQSIRHGEIVTYTGFKSYE